MMIKVVAKNYIAADKVDQCIELVKELVEQTKKEAGCISYKMYQDIKEPSLLTMIETWESEEALQAHMASPHFTRLVPQIGALAIKETEMNVYRKVI